MLFILGPKGDLTLTGSGACEISPIDPSQSGSYFCNPTFTYPTPAPNAAYTGLAVFQSRTNSNLATVTGNSDFHLSGIFYFPDNEVNAGGSGFSLGTQLICDRLTVAGNSNVTINYDGRNPINAASTVFLVE
jgi:hypothetical protein